MTTDAEETDVFEDAGFHVASMYGMRTRQPLVSVKLGDVAKQVTPDKAREMAQMLFEAAEAAEGDGFVLEYMADLAGDDADREQLAGHMLLAFRQFRERVRAFHEQNEQE